MNTATAQQPRLQALSFEQLKYTGANYIEWSYYMKAALGTKDAKLIVLETDTRTHDPHVLLQLKDVALCIIKQHLDMTLQRQLMTIECPIELWKSLAERFEGRKLTLLPRAEQDFNNLQMSSFKSVNDYNNALCEIVQRLVFCGDKTLTTEQSRIKKTLFTMDPKQHALRDSYKEKKFLTYNALFNRLIEDEEEQLVVVKNYDRRAPTGEMHNVESKQHDRKNHVAKPHFKKHTKPFRAESNKPYQGSKKAMPRASNDGRICFKCGTPDHIATNCKTSQHLVDLFKKSQGSDMREAHAVESVQPVTACTNDLAQLNFMESSDAMEVHGVFDATAVLVDSNCLIDSGTTHTILKSRDYFESITMKKIPLATIADSFFAEGQGRAVIQLGGGSVLIIEDAIFQPEARRNLLALKDLRKNGLHTATADPDVMHILTKAGDFSSIVDSYNGIGNGLYPVSIKPKHLIEVNEIERSPLATYDLWHRRIGHASDSTMRAMIGNVKDYPISTKMFSVKNKVVCHACAIGKMKKAAFSSVVKPLAAPLERLSLDLCGPIHPACGAFCYFQVLVDEFTGYIHVSLLSTKNLAFARLLSKLIQFKAQYPEHPIKHIRCDNASEYQSKQFDLYCESQGIIVEYSVPYTPQMNGRAEAANKSLLMIVRPLLLQSTLPMTCWGHAVLHAAALLNMRPTNNRDHSSIQLLTGVTPNASHLRIFGCAVFVPLPPTAVVKVGALRAPNIYVGFDSNSIIRYLDAKTGMLFKARFRDCVFDETTFPGLAGEDTKAYGVDPTALDISGDNWPRETGHLKDPRTAVTEIEVVKILSNQALAATLPDAFNNAYGVVQDKYQLMSSGKNAPERVEFGLPIAIPVQRKRGRPLGTKNKPKVPRIDDTITIAENEIPTLVAPVDVPVTDQIAIVDVPIEDVNVYFMTQDDKGTDIGDINSFSYHVAQTIINESDPATLAEAKVSPNWRGWQGAIRTEMSSLNSRDVFGEVQEAPRDKTLVGHRWVFVTKRNDDGEVIRQKGRLVAKGYSQKYNEEYVDTYSPVMDPTTLRFLTAFATSEGLNMQMMDVVTAYLYGSIDKEIYMTVPEGIDYNKDKFKRPCVRLNRSLYGLKQSGRMWFQRLSSFLTSCGFINSDISPCVFMKRSNDEFALIAVYVDDLNIIGTKKACKDAADTLSKEFEMKDLGETTFCIGLQFSRVKNGMLMHQKTFTQKLLEKFQMQDCKPLSSPMVVRKLDKMEDVFRPADEGEEILGENYPYFSAIGALMYLSNQTRPDIAFPVNLLARFSQKPTMRHWNGIKHIFRYLKGTDDMGLFYDRTSMDKGLTGYADAGYLSDPTNAKSQNGYVFLINGTAISWRSQKQTLTATSTNHSELIALYEATRECVWLRSMINCIFEGTGFAKLEKLTTLYEDNAACIDQIQSGFIKGDKTKHISPKFFYASELNGKEINVTKVHSAENIADLFTKSLPSSQHWHLLKKMGMRQLRTF